MPSKPRKKLSVRDICHIGFFAAIIAVCAQLSIPMPYGVPMTLQTFAVTLVGIVLGPQIGTMSTLIYVLLGVIGVPVFAGFTGGAGIVFGPTGGFILSFPIMAWTAGTGERKNSNLWLVFWLLAGMVVNYLCGMSYFSFFTSHDLKTAFAYSVSPFIPTGVIKLVLAAVLGKSLKAVLVKNGLLMGY